MNEWKVNIINSIHTRKKQNYFYDDPFNTIHLKWFYYKINSFIVSRALKFGMINENKSKILKHQTRVMHYRLKEAQNQFNSNDIMIVNVFTISVAQLGRFRISDFIAAKLLFFHLMKIYQWKHTHTHSLISKWVGVFCVRNSPKIESHQANQCENFCGKFIRIIIIYRNIFR